MPIEVKQIIHSKRKTLTLIVKPDGSLIVRAPLRTPEKSIREFIEKNVQWIARKQAQAREAVAPAPKKYVPGEMFFYLGHAYPLEIVDAQRSPLLLEKSFQLAASARSKAGLVFERWYRGQAKELLTQRVHVYAHQYGFQYQGIKITSARTRWGSCSSTGSLNFSWRLILAPMEVVDYVVIHELVHTVFHNHSRRFWKRVETIMPDYKERKKWLQKNGRQLMV